MKTYKLIPAFVFALLISTALFAQTTKETIKVNGECGMCKKKIEKAAKASGATVASWSPETKVLQVSYSTKKTSSDKIQKAIAAVGYDTEKYTATEEAYNNLDECCKYERKTAAATNEKCCNMEKCSKENCKDMDCCKDKDKNCCQKSGN